MELAPPGGSSQGAATFPFLGVPQGQGPYVPQNPSSNVPTISGPLRSLVSVCSFRCPVTTDLDPTPHFHRVISLPVRFMQCKRNRVPMQWGSRCCGLAPSEPRLHRSLIISGDRGLGPRPCLPSRSSQDGGRDRPINPTVFQTSGKAQKH